MDPEALLLDFELIDLARYTGADSVHPGYGFPVEKADAAQAFPRAGIIRKISHTEEVTKRVNKSNPESTGRKRRKPSLHASLTSCG